MSLKFLDVMIPFFERNEKMEEGFRLSETENISICLDRDNADIKSSAFREMCSLCLGEAYADSKGCPYAEQRKNHYGIWFLACGFFGVAMSNDK
jgi:hypothetical protein